jgi:hypothetical protein
VQDGRSGEAGGHRRTGERRDISFATDETKGTLGGTHALFDIALCAIKVRSLVFH